MKRISNQTTDELITLYIESATVKRAASTSNPQLDHRLYDRMEKIFHEIQLRGDKDIRQFYQLFEDKDPNIRLAAASKALWKLNERTAIPVLEEIEKANIQHLSFEAHWTLSEWRDRQQVTNS